MGVELTDFFFQIAVIKKTITRNQQIIGHTDQVVTRFINF